MMPLSAPQVLMIPELLSLIFEFLDKASNALNARVCRCWSAVALDVLWWEVDNLTVLFKLLAPLQHTADNSYRFIRVLDTTDWQHLQLYRSRIRSISYRPEKTGNLHESVFCQIARIWTDLVILPNLHSLEWNGPLESCVLFIHKSIRVFSVSLTEEITAHSPFFRDIIAKAMNITNLSLSFNFPVTVVEPDIVRLLQRLENLRTLAIPPLCFTNGIAEAAAYNRNLETIKFMHTKTRATTFPNQNFHPKLQEGAYISLSELSICTTFLNTFAFLAELSTPINLTNLTFESPLIETPRDAHQLLAFISRHCQQLMSLTLRSQIKQQLVRAHSYNRDHCMTV